MGTHDYRLSVPQSEFVVHCLAESLLAAEITFGCLNRCVSEQELNLLKFSALCLAKTSYAPKMNDMAQKSIRTLR